MNIYSVEVMIAATVYVAAKDEADAVEQVKTFHMDGGELRTGDEFIEGLPVSGARYSDPGFPEISISPAVTLYAEDLTAYFVEEVEDFEFDCNQAISEGWGIFESTERGWHIEKDDESTIFATDDDAVTHVHAQATMGSEYHAAALAWIEEHNE